MWHQSGSDNEMSWYEAKEWVKDLNSEGYAGYQDWRMPTLEEVVSLLESNEKNGDLYIDPVFSKQQHYFWTGDKDNFREISIWVVFFRDGYVTCDDLGVDEIYNVRPVRTVLSTDSGEEPEEKVYEEVEVLKKKKLRKPKAITLRSSYKTLSASEVQSMPNVSIHEKEEWGFNGHSTINHDYNLKAVCGDIVVVDNATGLMWHQSGSDDGMSRGEAKEWIKKLNKSDGVCYAGYHDWRLPAVDEAVSLLESSEKNGDLYTDPVFSKKQERIWTGDKFEGEDKDKDGSEAAWYVNFFNGDVIRDSCYNCICHDISVRPVRSVLSKRKIITLRSSYKKLSVSEVQSMPNVSIRKKDNRGFCGHSTINHDYNLKTIRRRKVVVDNATSLMWHQSGSGGDDIMFGDCPSSWDEAKEWVEDLNSEGYAGYRDWRLPTVDEAVSLLESSKKNGDMYIDPVFSKKQRGIWTGDWTGDVCDGRHSAWFVYFYNGHVYLDNPSNRFNYCVRPVRSMK
jgi:phage baseplate assembly protein gpV